MDVRLVVEKGSKKKREIRLKSEDTIIGRREGCDLRVPSASVSRRHCRLSYRDELLVVEDLQSANGTYVNGIRITDSQVVQPGDRLEVGPVTFLVKYKGAGETTQQDDIVPEFDMEEIEVMEGEEEKPEKKRKKTVAEPPAKKKSSPAPAGEKKPAPKKPPEKPEPAPEPAEENEDLPLAFDESTWRMPAGEDIRDILSQMDDSETKPE